MSESRTQSRFETLLAVPHSEWLCSSFGTTLPRSSKGITSKGSRSRSPSAWQPAPEGDNLASFRVIFPAKGVEWRPPERKPNSMHQLPAPGSRSRHSPKNTTSTRGGADWGTPGNEKAGREKPHLQATGFDLRSLNYSTDQGDLRGGHDSFVLLSPVTLLPFTLHTYVVCSGPQRPLADSPSSSRLKGGGTFKG